MDQKPKILILPKVSKIEEQKTLELVIDLRETCGNKIKLFLEGLEENSKNKIKIIQENLDIGDFLFRYHISDKIAHFDNDTNKITDKVDEKYENLVLIERKTVNDMLSSIKSDGRYKEQKIRLLALKKLEPSLRIFYLIEGIFNTQKIDKYFSENDRKIMSGAYLGTIVRDDLSIIISKDLNETFYTLQKITNLINENPGIFGILNTSDVSLKEYLIPTKIKKSENKDAKWCYLAALQQIQGVSDQVAIKIAEIYPNLQSLINAYVTANKNQQNLKLLLENVILHDRKVTKTGKSRTIGPALSEIIWMSLGSPS